MKQKRSLGRLVSSIGTLILSVGLICNGFEIISNSVFRLIVLVGIIVHLIALGIILKRKEL